jgi:hypothetical protein
VAHAGKLNSLSIGGRRIEKFDFLFAPKTRGEARVLHGGEFLMPKRKQKIPENKPKRERKPRPLFADYFYRKTEGPNYFGYGTTQLDERIRSGDVPPPCRLSPNGRATGWFGRTIIEYQQKIQATASKENAA